MWGREKMGLCTGGAASSVSGVMRSREVGNEARELQWPMGAAPGAGWDGFLFGPGAAFERVLGKCCHWERCILREDSKENPRGKLVGLL